MKKIYLLFLLCLSFWSWGQVGVTPQQKIDNRYQIEIRNYNFSSYGEDGICTNEINFYAIPRDNSSREEFFYSPNKSESFSSRKFFLKKEVKSINYRAFSQDRRRCWPNWCCDGAIALIDRTTPDVTFGVYLSASGYGNNGDGEATNNISFQYRLLPLHTLSADNVNGMINTYLPSGTKVNFNAKAGFNPNAAITLWEKMNRLDGAGKGSFLSTHPSNSQRIGDMRKNLPAALAVYNNRRK